MRNVIWDSQAREHIERPVEMVAFIEDIKQVCLKHNMSISHEDTGGAFVIEKYFDDNIDWLYDAFKNY